MDYHHRLQLLVALPLLLGANACVRSESTTIPNPLKAGQIQQNRIKNPDPKAEARYALPSGTLFHEASLVVLDEEQICFDLVLRVDGQRRSLATPEGWRVFLRGKPEFEDKAPRFSTPAPPEETSVPGVIETRATANQRICDSSGNNCYTKDVVITSHTPGQIPIVKAGGVVCFANQGHVTKATQEITLHLDDPNPAQPAAPDGTTFTFGGGNLMNRVGFQWKFIDGPVTTPVAAPSALALSNKSAPPEASETAQEEPEHEPEPEEAPRPQPKRAASKSTTATKTSAPPQGATPKKAPAKGTTYIDYPTSAPN
jgi:hypothetical protein